MSAPPTIERLSARHAVEAFSCGQPDLDRFLSRHALQNQRMGASQTYVAACADEVLGFYTLVFGEVAFDDAPDRLRKGLARHPVPLMVLARLAVSTDHQGLGLGSGMLKDAMLRTLQAAEIAGLRALAVHAKDETARRFYERFDFAPSPSDSMHLFVLLKDVRALIDLQGKA